jgi:hypothetical protein
LTQNGGTPLWEMPPPMIWFFIEAGVALALAIFIVWFTMGLKRKPPPATPQEHPDGDDRGGRG